MSFLANCTSGGCGAKIDPAVLRGVLENLPGFDCDRLLVGYDGADDAAVYKLNEETALVSTVDFFPPMVEDPYVFGQIAAANAMSDVWAMGGRVLYALNIVCFPQKGNIKQLGEMLKGGAEAVVEGGGVLCGGHSIYDSEPKYGLAVTGCVNPKAVLRNNTPKLGDCLILTKALGTGLVLAAARGGLAEEQQFEVAANSMRRLNKYAAEKLAAYPVSACTDITGFGLCGHGLEMAGEDYTLAIDLQSLPVLPGAVDFAGQYLATAAGVRNRAYAESKVDITGISAEMQEILFDPQTSGGLLISVPVQYAESLLNEIQADDPWAALIGQIERRGKCAVVFY